MEAKSVLLFVIIVVLIYIVYGYISKDVSTLSGLTSGQTMQTINATSLTSSSTTSGNTGNFTYSIWCYIDDWNYRYGEEKVVFGRMVSGSSPLQPCPSVILGALENNLIVSLSVFPGLDSEPLTGTTTGTAATSSGTAATSSGTGTTGTTTTTTTSNTMIHRCAVANIPIQKWVNLLVSVYGRSMDIYIDGKLVRTCVLPGVANIDSNAPVYITPNGGFSGWTSTFQYFPNATDPQTAWNIYEAGYGSSMLSNLFGKYTVKVSLMEGNTEDSSFSI
jgi:hypothetical protein